MHRVFATAGQEAFLEGHVHALRVLGGVPTGQVRYDTLKAAVAQVIGFSRQRVETDRWIAFRSHYGYRLEDDVLRELDGWLQPYRRLWAQRLDALGTEIARGQRERRHTPAAAQRRGPTTKENRA